MEVSKFSQREKVFIFADEVILYNLKQNFEKFHRRWPMMLAHFDRFAGRDSSAITGEKKNIIFISFFNFRFINLTFTRVTGNFTLLRKFQLKWEILKTNLNWLPSYLAQKFLKFYLNRRRISFKI